MNPGQVAPSVWCPGDALLAPSYCTSAPPSLPRRLMSAPATRQRRAAAAGAAAAAPPAPDLDAMDGDGDGDGRSSDVEDEDELDVGGAPAPVRPRRSRKRKQRTARDQRMWLKGCCDSDQAARRDGDAAGSRAAR